MVVAGYFSKIADDDEKAQAHFDKITEILGDNTLAKIKGGMEIWHEMTVYEEMMPVYLEYGLK